MCDPWLPQITRIWGFDVFQVIFDSFILISLDGESNTGSRICPITSHLFTLKYFFAGSNPRNIFAENFHSIRFDIPGTVSDSWM